MSLQLLVILVPVLFGLMGFALDFGRLYLIRGELNQAANAMALAAAGQLIGTAASLDNATAAANQSIDNTTSLGNKYNFGALAINQTNGNLSSTVNPPGFFATVADATSGAAGGADGTTARHVAINITADAPLLFWSLLPGGQSRKTPVAAQAIAGISAPLCTACGIEPFAVAAVDATDTVNFGFGDPAAGQNFTFVYQCAGLPLPTALPGAATEVPYAIINRFDTNATLDETQQLYRDGAGGLIGSTDPNPTGSSVPLACVGVNDSSEQLWASASQQLCTSQVTTSVTVALCGLYSRFDNANAPGNCAQFVTGFTDLSAAYAPDTDVSTGPLDLYTAYLGNGRRVITIAIVDALTTTVTGTMTVLGFRQFLLEPNTDGSFPNPADINGRFIVQYIGSPAPVKQGYFDDRFGLSCQVSSGPGKVVLHQ
ncbi:MAG TPA: pilus assembly protein TadG-related protein [Bryobacteraceae bacterium]|jgi:Flp pilus assembly protein TadG|nr:pilus assembly protein TadG-related protein [Bryobacteraceae bacterium]